MVLVISDGVGFRNFILSDFLNHAARIWEEVLIVSFLPEREYQKWIDKKNIRVVEADVLVETSGLWFWRKISEVAHLQKFRNHNFGMEDNLIRTMPKGSGLRGILVRVIHLMTRFFHSENIIQFFSRRRMAILSKQQVTLDIKNVLRTENPDLIFFSHQRPPFIAPVLAAARELKIPTASFIFSWDNLSSKGRMAGIFDHYLVWSELMKSELLHFYPRVLPSQAFVVGTPQFEPYFLDRYHQSEDEFRSELGLESDVQLICFSCGDQSTSPNDPYYIEVLANAMVLGKVKGKVRLVVRTSPAESPERFKNLQAKYPNIIWNHPRWSLTRKDHQEEWSQRVPEYEDLVALRSLLSYSSIGINMASTMSLDFMIFDKPVINPFFGNGKNGLRDDRKYLHYGHFQKVVESGAVAICLNERELIHQVNFSLENPSARRNEQRKLLQLQIGKPIPETGLRMAKCLNDLIN